ncbi:MAG: HAD-IA family hydrolase [Chloroflexi bacterium]|nr:HAD-IA family hydrolase [Chloroflexota bacterium]
MIKAVFFDFYNTLATHHPPREEAWINACREFGIKVAARALFQSLPAADKYWRDENSRSPIDKKTPEEKIDFYAEYGGMILRGAGAEVSRDTALQIMAKLRQYNWTYKVYDDTLPTLNGLKNRGLILGMISNVVQDMESVYTELGLQPYLAFKVTSSEVGCDKPQPEIFQAALKKAGIKSEEALYVGDQYDLDIVGARGVGMKAILVDRNDYFPDITDCPRIRSLIDIVAYI